MSNDILLKMLKECGSAVQRKVYESVRTSSTDTLSAVHAEKPEDTIYQIDRDVEDVLVAILEKYHESCGGFAVFAEGIADSEEGLVLGNNPKYAIIIDPIDGTRGIMYNKRPAFFLAGIALNDGKATRLSDIFVAVMVELPISKQFLADTLWAIKGEGPRGESTNMLTGEVIPKAIWPSKASTIIGGFAQFARFFPPGRDILAGIEDELIQIIVPHNPTGKALVFEDQYISTGGQLYEMVCGRDRFIADIRALLFDYLRKQNKPIGHVCHPYDICTMLIAKECGVIITDEKGDDFDAPFDLNYAVNWIGYANIQIRNEVEPIIMKLFKKFGLL
jgi:fructose-1,6-bisphosphatase/inositol monophosphatase family enzyme